MRKRSGDIPACLVSNDKKIQARYLEKKQEIFISDIDFKLARIRENVDAIQDFVDGMRTWGLKTS